MFLPCPPLPPPAQPPERSVCGFSALHHLEVSHIWGHTWHCLLPPSTWEYAVLGFYGSRENWQGDKAKPCRCSMLVSGNWQFHWDAWISLISITSVFSLWCLSAWQVLQCSWDTSAPLNSTDLMISLEEKLGIAWIRLCNLLIVRHKYNYKYLCFSGSPYPGQQTGS